MNFPPEMENLPLESRIGVSTLCVKGLELEEAIEEVRGAGFKTIEISASTHQPPESAGPSGSAPDLWTEVFDERRRESLREKLTDFALVTVHYSVPGLASEEEKEREQAAGQYLELMRFAHSIGARVVTMHAPGDLEGAEYTLEFARRAVKYAEEWGLLIGFEFFNREVISQAGSPRVGILFDIGHVPRREELMSNYQGNVAACIDDYLEDVVQFHVHGVHWVEDRYVDHLPINEKNVLDYDSIVEVWQRRRFCGPLIFEIARDDAPANLQNCVLAKEKLVGGAHRSP